MEFVGCRSTQRPEAQYNSQYMQSKSTFLTIV